MSHRQWWYILGMVLALLVFASIMSPSGDDRGRTAPILLQGKK